MDITGLTSGLTAALLMAMAFIASGWAIRKTAGLDPVGLIANAAIAMAVLSAGGLALLWTPELTRGFWGRMPSVGGIVIFWMLGQSLIFLAQRQVDASRIVPLLGLKLPILALIAFFSTGKGFTAMQILAIVLTVTSAFILNNAGKRIPLVTMGVVLAGCLFYSLSDIFVRRTAMLMLQQVTSDSLKSAAITTFLTYFCSGFFGVAVIAVRRKSRSARSFVASVPYAIFWLASIIFLTICFARVGTVNGNIIQATRGLFAAVLAPMLAMVGLLRGVEESVGWQVILRRIAAAALMVAAIGCYNM